MMNEDHCIKVERLVKQYKYRTVLRGLSLTIPRGSVFGLLGVNGAGKTTLLKCILGLLKPNAGHLRVLGDDPWRFQAETKARIGYVPQSDRLYPWLTVQEVIEYVGSFYPQWNTKLVDDLVRQWQINPSDKYGVLSEGEAQKVAIILAMGHEPDLFVLDEPVASLDPAARRQFLKTILEMVIDRGCTVFFSTHITTDLERVADHVAVMKSGLIDFTGELGQLKDEVKRLRLMSDTPLPKDVECPGLIGMERMEHEALLSVRGFTPDIQQQLEQRYQAQISVEDLNLEEIFLELNR